MDKKKLRKPVTAQEIKKSIEGDVDDTTVQRVRQFFNRHVRNPKFKNDKTFAKAKELFIEKYGSRGRPAHVSQTLKELEKIL